MKSAEQKKQEAEKRQAVSDKMTPFGKLIACDSKPGACRKERLRLYKKLTTEEKQKFQAYLDKGIADATVVQFMKKEV